MEPIIEIKNLNKHYGKKIVLKDINLKINKGESIAILGANGAGKTTLVEIISQTKKPSSGEVIYYFKDHKIKEHIGIQFQEGNWPDGLSAYDMLAFYKAVYPKITNQEINALIKAFDLKEFLKRPLNRLSGGQKQRFNALLAIIHSPELIILDEVSTGLDLQLRHNILKFLKNMITTSQKTILLVSHSPDEVEYLCERLVIIDNGQIFYDAPMSTVLTQYQSVNKLMDTYFEGGLK